MNIDKSIISAYKLTPDREKDLWDSTIFVFDSSALLELYFLPKKTRQKIYTNIFEKIPTRLWIPYHVQYEYLKNREDIIKKPITKKYNPLKERIKKLINEISPKILNEVQNIENETKKDDSHPHVEQTNIHDFKKVVEKFLEDSKVFENKILQQIDTSETEVLQVAKDDDILKAIEKHFQVGREFSFDEIIEITKEGKHRFEFSIPPGYGDLVNKSKKGTQIFGDLIIWKQILEFSHENQLPIIFVTNDMTKDDDWCYLEKNIDAKRIHSPREELIKEMKDFSNVDFWMYDLPQFLYKANEYIDASIEEEQIESIAQQPDDFLIFECNSCEAIYHYSKDELFLEFELVDSYERSMGAENHYEAQETVYCDCNNEIVISFNVWEYPIGIHNHNTIEITGAKLLHSFWFTLDFYRGDIEY